MATREEKLPSGETVDVETSRPPGTVLSKEDKRFGDPDEGGLSSGEKASITRAAQYGDTLHFIEDPKKREAAKSYAQEHGLDISASLSKYEQ